MSWSQVKNLGPSACPQSSKCGWHLQPEQETLPSTMGTRQGAVCHDGSPLTATLGKTSASQWLHLFVNEINSGESHENRKMTRKKMILLTSIIRTLPTPSFQYSRLFAKKKALAAFGYAVILVSLNSCFASTHHNFRCGGDGFGIFSDKMILPEPFQCLSILGMASDSSCLGLSHSCISRRGSDPGQFLSTSAASSLRLRS